MHRTHEARGLIFGEGTRVSNMNAEVTEAGRLHQLVGGDRSLHAALRQISGLQILHGIESCAGTLTKRASTPEASSQSLRHHSPLAGRIELCVTAPEWRTLLGQGA